MNMTAKVLKVFRGLWMRLRYAGGRLTVRGLILLALRCELEIDRGASVTIGNKAVLENGTLLAARKGSRVELGEGAYVNRNCTIVSRASIVIGEGVTIGPNCCIYDHDHDLKHRGDFVTAPVTIEKNVWIGAGCILLKGVTVGENAVIGAGAVVSHDVPKDTVLVQRRADTYVSR